MLQQSRGLFRGMMIAAAATSLLATICSARATECKNPGALVFSIIPSEESAREVNLYKPLVDKLKQVTGKRVEFYMPTC